MKKYLYISIVVVATVDCTPSNGVNSDVIPGIYARDVRNEFSEGRDTLFIVRLEGDAYGIEQRLAYRRIDEGKMGGVETKTEHWTAFFDEAQHVLRETKRGRVLSFQPEKRTLLVGSSVYQKLD